MSLESRLINLGVTSRTSATVVVLEYIDNLMTLKKFLGRQYYGRESHLKYYAYKLTEKRYT